MKHAEHNTLHSAMVGLAGLVAIALLAPGVAYADPAFASTFVGGSSNDSVSVAVRDASGDIYVVGGTNSADFPTTPGVHGPAYHGGGSDFYVAKFDRDLTTLLAATYVGGSSDESAPNLVIDSHGDLLVAGRTLSTDIPVTSGAYQTSKSAQEDLFVVKLSGDLTTVVAATYLGGSQRRAGAR